jgi:precorrin-2 dehydrogenase/sirohydrochlorin ferrochelatase
MNTLFPAFLKLSQLDTLIVGGGEIGLEKLHTVLNNDSTARILLVAKRIGPAIRVLAAGKPNVKLKEKAFDIADLANKDLVLSATRDKSLNLLVWQKAKERRILVNVADTPALCDFYLASTVQKDDLKIAISSNGKSPMLTKRIRQYLEAALPDTTQDILDNLSSIRAGLEGDLKVRLEKLEEITEVLAAN